MNCGPPYARGSGACCCNCCPPPKCDKISYDFNFTKNICSSSSLGPCLCNCCTNFYYESYIVTVGGISNNPHGLPPRDCNCTDLNGTFILYNRNTDPGCPDCFYTTDEQLGYINNDPNVGCVSVDSLCPTDNPYLVYPKWILHCSLIDGILTATFITSQAGDIKNIAQLYGTTPWTCEGDITVTMRPSGDGGTYFPGCISSSSTITLSPNGPQIPCSGPLGMTEEMTNFVNELTLAGTTNFPFI